MSFIEEIYYRFDGWLQRKLTTAEPKELVERDLVKQRLSGQPNKQGDDMGIPLSPYPMGPEDTISRSFMEWERKRDSRSEESD